MIKKKERKQSITDTEKRTKKWKEEEGKERENKEKNNERKERICNRKVKGNKYWISRRKKEDEKEER